MPYVNKPRPYKKEYQQQQARGELARRMERQRLRRSFDKTHADGDKDGTADAVQSVAKNRSFKRDSQGNLVGEVSKKERKKK